MGQADNGCDTALYDHQSSLPKHLFLRIVAVTILVVAVRVAVTAAMTSGLGSPDGEQEQEQKQDQDHDLEHQGVLRVTRAP
jgi:hypothetical protein